MRATVHEQLPKRDKLRIFYEIEEKEVAVQDDGFLIQRGQAWLVVGPAREQEAYKLEPEVTKEVQGRR